MTKSKKKNLERLLETLLKEYQPQERPEAMQDFAGVAEKPFSLDQAIDRYFVQYERESIPSSEMFESAKVDSLVKFLFEQEEEEPLDEPADEGGEDLDLGGDVGGGLDLGGDIGGDLGGDAPDAGAEGAEPGEEGDEQPVVNTPKINLQDFTRSVARLVNNIHSLIDLNTLVLNRAEKYIQSNYDERTAKEMMEILDTSYDLRPTDDEVSSQNMPQYPEPRAGVTGPVGG